eukprot:NODE_147_length_15617_cov_0.576750.p13 type:complete len:220 gc:universal NODE_147_length_15617_cov_0.576750:13753-14412(+)
MNVFQYPHQTEMSPKLKLTYFDMRGRAESIRLSLEIANIPFEDHRLKREDWPAFKPNTPFGQVPILTIDDKTVLAQSMAILRYVGKLGNLYPQDALQAAFVDQIIHQIADIGDGLVTSFQEKDEVKKMQMREKLANETWPLKFKALEAVLVKFGNGYAVGNQMSIADVLIYTFTWWITSGVLDGIPKTILDQYPTILKVRSQVHEHPKVSEWNAKVNKK